VKAQAMPPGLLLASSLATPPPRLPANSRANRRTLLQAKSQPKVMPLVQQQAKQPLLVLRVRPKEERFQQPLEILPGRAHAHPCLKDPDPFSFCRGRSGDQKCNRAARCGDCPTSVRCRWRYNRREFVGYGSTRIHLLRKRAHRAGTFPIADADRCLSPLRRIQD
jgi:hypothetical protein